MAPAPPQESTTDGGRKDNDERRRRRHPPGRRAQETAFAKIGRAGVGIEGNLRQAARGGARRDSAHVVGAGVVPDRALAARGKRERGKVNVAAYVEKSIADVPPATVSVPKFCVRLIAASSDPPESVTATSFVMLPIWPSAIAPPLSAMLVTFASEATEPVVRRVPEFTVNGPMNVFGPQDGSSAVLYEAERARANSHHTALGIRVVGAVRHDWVGEVARAAEPGPAAQPSSAPAALPFLMARLLMATVPRVMKNARSALFMLIV